MRRRQRRRRPARTVANERIGYEIHRFLRIGHYVQESLTEGEVFGNFQHVGDSLFIQCYSIKELQTDTTIVEESYGFRPFNNIRLKIESIDDDNLR